MKFRVFLLAVVLALTGLHAQAKRMGGGKSIGQQSSHVAQRQGVSEASGPALASSASKPVTPGPAATPGRSWGTMLGGVAAGLGLAWLAHSLGFGAGFAQVLLLVVVAFAVVLAVKWWLRKRSAQGVAQQPSAFAFQAAGAPQIAPSKNYRPENVGNDASARPWERNSMLLEEAGVATGSIIGSGLSGSQSWGVPAGFDSEGFLKAAKANFVTLQAAWDKANIPVLRSMMTDTMLQEIQAQLAERETQAGDSTSTVTDVAMIDARLLGVEDLEQEYMASVEFSGMIREEASAGPNPFREVWNMTKSKKGTNGWLVAGVQALQ